ncbi:hypothetical protein AB0M91_13005 [Micromonospora rifamycinica]|uniref:hypothetical protein n=1 Tax=Micromonospora rifamycinica TaxID=291594 RepID=UPI0034430DB0
MTRHRLDPEAAERLLSGPATGPEVGLGALLAALRAAPTPAELRGEQAVMSAFRAARSGRRRPASPGPAGGSPPLPGGALPTGRS